MGVIGDFLSSNAGNIGEWVDKNIFGGSGKTGRNVGSASSSLLKLLPFEDGTGMVKLYNPKTKALVHTMPLMEYRQMQKGGMIKQQKKKTPTKKTKKSKK